MIEFPQFIKEGVMNMKKTTAETGKKEEMNRRSFLHKGTFGLLSLPIVASSLIKDVFAQAPACPTSKPASISKKIVDPNKSKAKQYVEKTPKPAEFCANCKYYKTKKEEGGYAPCTMFGNRYVINCGYCKLYKKV